MPTIEAHAIFAVPLYAALLESVRDAREPLRELVLARKGRDPGVHVTERNGWHSSGALFDDAAFAELGAMLLDVARAALVRHVAAGAAPYYMASWAVVSGKSGAHVPHSHYGSAWSGVLYVDVERVLEGRSDARAGCIEFLAPMAAPESFGAPSGAVYTPRDGLVLLFPSNLVHLVHPSESDADRICISFNLGVR